MRKLIHGDPERGAVAVWVGILLVPLMVAAALAVDIGLANADRQRLQHGADAGALAIAQDCAAGGCGDVNGTAQRLVGANNPFIDESALGALTANADLASQYVEVEATSERPFIFAPVMGDAGAPLRAVGAAVWGPVGSGRSSIPFTFAACELAGFGVLTLDANGNPAGLNASAIGTRVRLFQSKVSNVSGCDQPTSGNYVEGGFGWLEPEPEDADDCSVFTEIGEPADSGDGNAMGNADAPCYRALQRAVDAGDAGEVSALLPVFTTQETSGHKQYTIVGYVAVTLEGYRFQGNRYYGEDEFGRAASVNQNRLEAGNGGWIVITPQRFVASEADFQATPTAPDLGTSVVSLVLPREVQP